ncbi:MAG: pyruvate/2-oxoglutarate dehydrogenase complex dihydrolipoamide dehydrogenase (E3) component, partial [Lentisphaeria bacterium]
MKKPSSFDANLIVIGAGAAGLVSAYIAAAVKAKVILIEKEKMGGDCLNTGCVPSKALIKAAKVAHLARNSGKYGVNINNVDIDFDRVMARVHEAVGEVEPHDSVERYSKLGVECIAGAANIISPHEVQVGDRVYSSRHIIVASGA